MYLKLNSHLKSLFNQFRCYSVQSSKIICGKIRNKSVVKVDGEDSGSLLQGLITNDIAHLQDPNIRSIYSYFLNNKGRIMFDTIISKERDDSFYIECDTSLLVTLEKHLKRYKLRKKVQIKVEDNLNVYSVLNLADVLSILPQQLLDVINNDSIVANLNQSYIDLSNYFNYKDPRINILGKRVLASNLESNLDLYELCRYWLGVAEGVNEIPFESCFPLEYNGDYLHGISFSKGCYIGQELTARSYHTGVIRKRIMPIVIDQPDVLSNLTKEHLSDTSSKPSDPNDYQQVDIMDSNNKKIGKLRGVNGKYGIALLRVNECLKLNSFNVSGTTGRCFKPTWWPQDPHKVKDVT